MNSETLGSARLRRFKKSLTAQIPLRPNNKATREEFRNQSLADILFFYLHWRSRFIPARPRQVTISPEVTRDKRWGALGPSVHRLLDKVRDGQSLEHNLSRQVHTRGYSPPKKNSQGQWDLWSDKDQILNLTGFHHLHLNEPGEEPSDDMLFGLVKRDSFHAVGLFDHSVFGESDAKHQTSSERQRMWAAYNRLSEATGPGLTLGSRMVMTTGHPMNLLRWSDQCWEDISTIDPQLESPTYLASLYDTPYRMPKLEWRVCGLDIGILDRENSKYFIVNKGPI